MNDVLKRVVATKIAERLKSGETIGVGTGSTVAIAITCIAERVKAENLHISAIVTSYQSAIACADAGIAVIDAMSLPASAPNWGQVDWGFDGADEVDDRCRLIKGLGGAMLREKIVASLCKHYIIIIDESKLSSRLGSLAPVPIECVSESLSLVKRRIETLGATHVSLRSGLPGKHGPVITERGNLILDAWFSTIEDSLELDIKSIPGVVESGLFVKYASEVWSVSQDLAIHVRSPHCDTHSNSKSLKAIF